MQTHKHIHSSELLSGNLSLTHSVASVMILNLALYEHTCLIQQLDVPRNFETL